jgi:hypothetical protein
VGRAGLEDQEAQELHKAVEGKAEEGSKDKAEEGMAPVGNVMPLMLLRIQCQNV